MGKQNFSILQTIDAINEELNGENLKSCAYKDNGKLKKLTESLGAEMKRTPLSALHFAALVCLTIEEDSVYTREIIRFLKVPVSQMSTFSREIDALVDEGLVYRNISYGSRTEYGIPMDIRKKVFSNEIPEALNLTTDVFGFDEYVEKYLNILENNRSQYDYVEKSIISLLNANTDLPISQYILSNKLATREKLMTLYVFHRVIIGHSQITVRDICEVVSKSSKDRFQLRVELMNGNHLLFTSGMVAWEGDDMQSAEYFEVTESGKSTLLGEETAALIKKREVTASNGLILPESIKSKSLYYNENEKNNIALIEELVSPSNYNDVCDRFRSKGMNAGICALFYGGPGTGKTESVLQIARKTGRPISQIDISSIKDKWVGESEKRAKAIFDNYRKLLTSGKTTPILLLNEADAIINKRINVERSVDQMYNAIQNIFLEEMEKFEGILIATTNLENNFDPAFDRRFLFKIGFDKPSVNVRASIIRERISNISHENAQILASKFELSGGQVENVARKALTDVLLKGVEPSMHQLEVYCAEEVGFRKNKSQSSRIGFDINGDKTDS